MAARYWVGGSGTWNGANTANWSATSGGSGGASIPTSTDDAIFNSASNATAYTVTVGSITAPSTLNISGPASGNVTVAGTGNVDVMYSLTTSATGITWTNSGGIRFLGNSTGTLTTNGFTLPANITFQGGTFASVTLGSALTITGSLTLTSGTFTTNNYAVTALQIVSNNTNVRTINLGSSTVTLSGNPAFDTTTNTNLTLNAGTSSIVCTGASCIFQGGATSLAGLTFYNVSFTNTAVIAQVRAINTFNNLTITGPASAGITSLYFDSPQTINGTLSTTGTAGNRRVAIRAITYGLAQTLRINSAPSLTDADFRDIYVIGTSAPISGTRIGNLRGCSGITFDVAKTVYWVTLAGGNWSGTNWSNSVGGGASTDYFPLAQDTANIVNTGLNTSATVTIDANMASLAMSGIDMSARTNAMTLSLGTGPTVYGNWTNGSGTTISGGVTLTFSGRNTQTITSATKAFGNVGLSIDSYGGTVELGDAFSSGSGITVNNGTFNTKNYNVTISSFSSFNSNVRTVIFGSSVITLTSAGTAFNFGTSTNLTFTSATSQITFTGSTATTLAGGDRAFYNVSFNGTNAVTHVITGANTFNNLTITAPSSAGLMQCTFATNNTINGTLTVAGATAVRRIFLRSDTLGTTRTLTVNTLSATDCDFRDITIAGTAAGSSPTRAGDCGGNTGITFPAAKTVYWNLAGAQNWSATGWCPSSGGTPDINQFPLAQDTAVFDNTGAAGTVNIQVFNIGTINASSRTTAVTLGAFGTPDIYGNFTLGTGVTIGATSQPLNFSGRGTQTITSNGVTIDRPITVDCITGTFQLADAFILGSARTLTLTSGTFDAVTYNVTVGLVSLGSTIVQTLKMGSGTWTLSGTGTVWAVNNTTNFTLYKGTANIVLSDTSTTARSFVGNGLSYNKLTIGGTTGTSTTTIAGNNQFTELASTKTVAHTIGGTQAQTFGAWTVTGTAGNVVTLSGTATITIAGARVSGVDYLALGTTTMSTTSPAEFYAGVNSTGGTRFILTAAPTPVTRYWRGGTGTWDATTTTNWSDTSGGSGGFSVPTSADAVIFDSASNATAYTVTCTATQLRCGSLTMAGPASGNVTWAGTAPLAIHSNVSLAATGITRSYSGDITLTGSTTGKTFTTNGVTLGSSTFFYVNGIGSGWSLGSALDASGISAGMYLINGSFDTAGYALSLSQIYTPYTNTRSLTFGASTITLSSASGLTASTDINLTINAGTSTILMTAGGQINTVSPTTFYNVTWTNTSTQGSIYGINTFNNVTFSGRTSAGLSNFYIRNGTQTINGTLSITAGTNATMRTFIQSDVVGSSRSFVVNAFSGTDADFRDITVTGAAAPISGTRLGDCKGNSGITFGAGVTRYWNLAGGGNWGGAIGWAATSGGSPAINNFPLAQDTALFEATGLTSGSTVTINAAYNIGTINMSARTSNTMTLAQGSITSGVYGNFIVGTGVSFSGTPVYTFAGRGTQQITSAGKQLRQLVIDSPGGSVVLQDALDIQTGTLGALTITSGTFNANGYNVTLSSATNSSVSSSNTNIRTIAIGSGTWTIAGNNGWGTSTATNLTVTGTGTISLTSASAKTFAGGSVSYSGITINQGGAGTLTISGNNTFANITNTYSATGATTIAMGTTTQTVGAFTATGAAGKVLTVQGSSASSPATLILTSGTVTTPDYLAITGVRAYNLSNTWYAGANSTNNGSLGWIFAAAAVVSGYFGNFFVFF